MKKTIQRKKSETPSLRDRNKQDKLERISRAARFLFEKKGYDSTTIREIAKRADVGLGTVFFYAKDKRELIFLIFKDDLARLFKLPAREPPAGTSNFDQFMLFFRPLLEFLRPNAALARVMVREALSLTGDRAKEYQGLIQKLDSSLQTLVKRGQARGEIRDDIPVDALVQGIWGCYRFYTDDWLRSPNPNLAEGVKHLRQGFDLLYLGIGTRHSK